MVGDTCCIAIAIAFAAAINQAKEILRDYNYYL
jgi:hypothetical protein